MLDCHWTLKIFWDSFIHMLSGSLMLHHLCLFHMLGWTLAFLIQNLFCNLNFLLMVLDLLHMFPLIGHPSLHLSLPFTIGILFISFNIIHCHWILPLSWLIVCVWGQFWVKPLLMFLAFNHGAWLCSDPPGSTKHRCA